MNKKRIFVVINLKNFDVNAYTTKGAVAGAIGCHRNTLNGKPKRWGFGNYLIYESYLHLKG